MKNDAWENVKRARSQSRPTAKDLISNLFDNFIELKGDYYFGDDPSIIGGIGFFNGVSVTIIAQEKGKNTQDKIARNFGMTHPEGYRKALRLMKQAEKFKRPIITIIDTPGAYPGVQAEERGQSRAIANNLFEMIALNTPIISIILGEGGSGGALALNVSDITLMMENAIYSVISPEGFATILYKDAKLACNVAKDMKLTARDLLDYGFINEIISENDDYSLDYAKLKENINLMILNLNNELKKGNLLESRFSKYMNF